MINISKLEANIIKFEGSVGHMYLDSADIPKVTIGIGHHILNQADAGRLPLYFKEDVIFLRSGKVIAKPFRQATASDKSQVLKKNSKADPEHAKAEYAYLRILNIKGYKASFFDGETFLYMQDADIKALLHEDIQNKIREVRAALKKGGFNTLAEYPAQAQEAIVSMSYILGAEGLLGKIAYGQN